MATRIEPVQGVIKVVAATAAAGLTHSGPQTVDTSIAAVAGDLVLDKDNATGSLQGIWQVAAGAWVLVDPGTSDGLVIEVLGGTVNADHSFRVTNSVVWGTDTPTFVDQGAGGGTLNTLTGDIVFSKEANHQIYVNASTTAATTGGSLSSAGAAGSAAGAGTAAGAGGGNNVTGGAGGAASATNAAADGGASQIKGGLGGAASAAQAAGKGGAVSIVGGAAGSVSLGGAGNDGGALNLDGGAATGSGAAGAVTLATSNSASLTMGRTALVFGLTAKTSTITQGVSTTGSPVALTLTGAAHTTLTASTEASDVNFNLNRTVQFATGAITTQRAVQIVAPTYGFVGGSTITNAATFAITNAPQVGGNATFTNAYALWVQAGKTQLDGGLTVTGLAGLVTLTQPVATSGSPTALLLTGGAHTTLTASAEAIDANFNLARTVQFATGALTTQRAALFQAPTYAAVAASTITNAATLAISGAPVQGTNATLTNTMALWVQGGAVNLGDATVSQATNIDTGVAINGASGVITTQSASAGARSAHTGFTVTNSAVLAGSVVIARVVAYAGTLFTNGFPDVIVTSVAAGSFVIKPVNTDDTNALSGTMKIHFAVL